MKIDGSAVNALAQAIERVGTPAAGAGKPSSVRPGPQGDSVKLSTDAQALQQVLRGADDAPAIRADVVERMRAAMDRGEVGNDAAALADALIDAWITK